MTEVENDWVRHPSHYQDPSGYECIQFTERMNCPNLANAFRYVWRAGKKWDDVEDLNKAIFYVDREGELRNSWTRPARVAWDGKPVGHAPGDDEMFTDFVTTSLRVESNNPARIASLSSLWVMDMYHSPVTSPARSLISTMLKSLPKGGDDA